MKEGTAKVVTFDLLDEPWLPCVLADGRGAELGVREVLERAHEIRELFDPSPLVTVSLHRLLLAVLHRALLGPPDLPTWSDLWRRGRWDAPRFDAYLDRWRHRFDLFHPERPFYQVPTSPELGEAHPIALLAQEAASGNNATLFDHRLDAAPRALSPAAAARSLIARQAFSIGFGKSQPFYFTDSPFLRGYSVLARGDTLFETLALNLLPYNAERPIPRRGDDAPAWEHDPAPEPDAAGTPPRGYVDYLTWQSRRIHLLPGGSPLVVARCQVRQHLKIDAEYRDPFKSYVPSKERGVFPRGLNPDRAPWRDSAALFGQADGGPGRPEVFQWLARVDGERRAGRIDARPAYAFDVVGFASDAGKAASVVLWRHERLPLPLAYLDDPALVSALRDALTLAEHAGALLRHGFDDAPAGGERKRPRPLQVLAEELLPAPGDSRPDPAAVAALVAHLAPERRYWSRLETPFHDLLLRLPDDRAEDDGSASYGVAALPRWAATLAVATRRAFDEAAAGLDASARGLKAVARARATLDRRLGADDVLGPYLSPSPARDFETPPMEEDEPDDPAQHP